MGDRLHGPSGEYVQDKWRPCLSNTLQSVCVWGGGMP